MPLNTRDVEMNQPVMIKSPTLEIPHPEKIGMEPGLEPEPENPGFHMDFGTRVFKFKTRKPGILNVNYSSKTEIIVYRVFSRDGYLSVSFFAPILCSNN